MSKIYIARQPILNVNGKVFGYELLFRDSSGRIENFPSNLTATARVLINTLNHMDFHGIRGGEDRVAFINIDHDIIKSGIIEMLDPTHFVLELLETTEISDELIADIIRLKGKGFKFAIDDFDCSNEMIIKFGKIFKLVDIIKIDIMLTDKKAANSFIKKIKAFKLKILAEKVETKEDYRQYSEMGFDLFQGYYFQKPEIIEGKIYNNTTSIEILKLIELIRRDKDANELKKFFSIKPDLSFNLIKYLNTPFFGLKEEISSVQQAITLIGTDQLLRWLLFYLYSEYAANEFSEALLETAISRAVSMEEIAGEKDSEKAYLTGMYSLLDALVDADFSEIFSEVNIDRSIIEAIVDGKGNLGKALTKIQSLERNNIQSVMLDNYKDFSMKKNLELFEKVNSTEVKIFKKKDK